MRKVVEFAARVSLVLAGFMLGYALWDIWHRGQTPSPQIEIVAPPTIIQTNKEDRRFV